MVVILGDLHLNSSKPAFTKASYAFLDWYRDWNYNSEQNEIIFAGDIVHSSINAGLVIDMMEKLIKYSKFHHIHIVVGNHDKKKKDGVDQLAYTFFNNKENVTVYEKVTEVSIQGHDCLLMPYYMAGYRETSMSEVYSNLPKTDKAYAHEFDLIVGHFACTDNIPFPMIDSVSLKAYKAKHICLGHIHTRELDPKMYIGSVFANRKNENDPTRAAWILRDNNTLFEEKLPVFTEFLTVTYPEDLPKTNAIVPIYTVLRCSSEKMARDLYGDIFIRYCTVQDEEAMKIKRKEIDSSFLDLKGKELKDMFNEFLKTKDPPLNRNVVSKCMSLLS